jgi:hypothetical protein
MKKKITILLLLIALVIEAVYLVFWLFHCKNFQEILHVNFQPLALQLKGEAGQDYGLPLLIVRFFHNKLIDSFLLIIKTYFRFWDFTFFGELFPFLGGFGILVAGYYFFASKTKRILHWILFLLFLSTPFIELFFSSRIPFLIRIGLFYTFFASISLVGLWKFTLSHKRDIGILMILAIISVWWLLIADFHLATFCYQYPL